MEAESSRKSRRSEAPSGVRTGAYLPSEIVHSSGRLARLADPKANAKQAGHMVQRLLGFWFVYNAMGGVDAMIQSGLWPRSTAYKQLADFRAFYGCEPEELEPDLVASLREAAATWPEKYAGGFDAVVQAYREARGSDPI